MYAVGIDVSKGKSTVAILGIGGEIILEPTEIKHIKSDIDTIFEKIKDIPKEEVKFIMEATGNYHLPVLKQILEKEYFVCVENALTIKKYCDIKIRKAKTDKKDALKLADYGIERWHKLKKYVPSEDIRSDLKFLSREYNSQIALKVKSKVELSNLIDLTFPGLNDLISNENCIFLLLEIYIKYPHPEEVLKSIEAKFINDFEKISKKLGHRIGKVLAEKVYALAKETIPTRPNNSLTHLAVQECVSTLLRLEESTKNIITEMDKLSSELPEFNTVSKMKGVGKKIRSRLIAEIGDVKRFKNASSLIAYAGIDTPPYESGQFKATQIHISKRGNKSLRKVGYETMKSLKSTKPKEDNAVYLYILKKESEGKSKKTSKIAGLNKFLRIYYARVIEVF